MIFLGIDPGTTRIGYGVVDHQGSAITPLAYGIVSNPGKDKLADFQHTEKVLGEIIAKYKPEGAGIEKLFFTKNQTTAMAVSEMRGVLLLTLAKHNLPIQEFTPTEIKQMVTGYGHADKNQVLKMVQLVLHIKEHITPDDAADALAIAICCSRNILSI